MEVMILVSSLVLGNIKQKIKQILKYNISSKSYVKIINFCNILIVFIDTGIMSIVSNY